MGKIDYNQIKVKEVIIAEHTESQKPLNGEPQPDITFFAINVWIQYLDIDGDVVFEERTAYKKDELPPAFRTILKSVLTVTEVKVREERVARETRT